MKKAILLVAAVAASALIAQDRSPNTGEVAKAFDSKVSEHGFQILFWEKRFAIFTVHDIRGWEIRFKLCGEPSRLRHDQ